MVWQRERARKRIENYIDGTPQTDIRVEDFARFLTEQRATRAQAGLLSDEGEFLLRVPRNRAVTTHGVHVYANLTGFNERLTEGGRETEASHRRSLQFLHTHYSACDRLLTAFGIQRVDFHGSRLHAVVLAPLGDHKEGERINRAMAFAAAFREMVRRTAERFGSAYGTGVRIGIDSGPAVAIDGGKSDEPEPLFIGSPANHAAKLADGDEDGIYPSARVKVFLAAPPAAPGGVLNFITEQAYVARDAQAGSAAALARRRLDEAFAAFEGDVRGKLAEASDAVFRFHHKEPPLSTIKFVDHPPSNTIRMPLASLFADIDGFTAYIDEAILTGRVAEAVTNLHVLRAEMAAVLRDDFGGRKVRFVGDCVHGVLAKGDARTTDTSATVEAAIHAAGGIRSSFDLCRMMLPNISGLGLAIGIDLGDTPICRLGLRGMATSVRCASSRATCVSESEQRRCDGREAALGETAYAAAPASARHAFRYDRKVQNLTAETSSVLLGVQPSPYTAPAVAQPVRAHAPQPVRAHSDS